MQTLPHSWAIFADFDAFKPYNFEIAKDVENLKLWHERTLQNICVWATCHHVAFPWHIFVRSSSQLRHVSTIGKKTC